MIYLKTYEIFKWVENKTLKKGDVISFFNLNWGDNNIHIGEIIKIKHIPASRLVPEYIEYYVIDEKDREHKIVKAEIERKLTPEQAEEFKILKISNKYNL